MLSKQQTASFRRYDLDWLRVLAIILVLYYHVGMIYNEWGYHIKNSETSPLFSYIMAWLHQWRMPLLLFISGAGTVYATSKRSLSNIFSERSRRLMVPLIFSMLVIVPPQIYFERIAGYGSYADFYPTVFEFVPYPEGGSFSWHHMWFVLYLFLYSVLALPLLKFVRANNDSVIHRFTVYMFFRKPGFLIWFLIIVFSQLLLRPLWPEETHSLLNDWAYFVQYMSFYIAGILITAVPGVWEQIKNNRRMFLICGLASYFLMVGAWYLPEMKSAPAGLAAHILYEANNIFMGWTWILAIAGYGYRYLNRDHKHLRALNEGVYPFYILHQTVLIAVGFYFMKITNNIWMGFFGVSVISLVCTVLIYIIFVRPFNLMRYLFGMKPYKKAERINLFNKKPLTQKKGRGL